MNKIDSFFGEYRWLSNFWPCAICWEKLWFPSVEHAYQAAKAVYNVDKDILANSIKTAGAAKRFSRGMKIDPTFDNRKLEVMEELLRQKFRLSRSDPTSLGDKLLSTGDAELIEGNTWGDIFWGVCDGKGENHLGKLLMKIREDLKKWYPDIQLKDPMV